MNGKTKRRSPQVTLFNNKLGLSRAFETLQPVNPISKHQNKFRMQRRTQNLKVKARHNSISSVDFFQCVFCLISIKKFKKYEIRFMRDGSRNRNEDCTYAFPFLLLLPSILLSLTSVSPFPSPTNAFHAG